MLPSNNVLCQVNCGKFRYGVLCGEHGTWNVATEDVTVEACTAGKP